MKYRPRVIKCIQCSKDFISYIEFEEFCSPSCKNKHYQKEYRKQKEVNNNDT